ncbi:MAG TPA: Fe-S cluster assembly transcriptional regulator IscR, partial [Gammaproteobacteria bacterium]|nr:Fe-S cluster assembly transcriptional regulator IscR [Gammaproteobacteria bacterium]
AIDEKVDATRCGGLSNCQDDQQCLTHELWSDLSQQIYEFLSGISLGHLVERRGVKEVAARQDTILQRQVVGLPETKSVGR